MVVPAMVRGYAAYLSKGTLYVRASTVVLVVSPSFAQLALFEHGALLQTVIGAIAPSARLAAGKALVELFVVQLLDRDAYCGGADVRDVVTRMDACHHSFVSVCLC